MVFVLFCRYFFVCTFLSFHCEVNMLNKDILNKYRRAHYLGTYLKIILISSTDSRTLPTNFVHIRNSTRFVIRYPLFLFPDVVVWKGRLLRSIGDCRMAHVQAELCTAVWLLIFPYSQFFFLPLTLIASCVCVCVYP